MDVWGNIYDNIKTSILQIAEVKYGPYNTLSYETDIYEEGSLTNEDSI